MGSSVFISSATGDAAVVSDPAVPGREAPVAGRASRRPVDGRDAMPANASMRPVEGRVAMPANEEAVEGRSSEEKAYLPFVSHRASPSAKRFATLM